MKRSLRPEETRLWAAIAATVRPHPGRTVPVPPENAPAKTAPPPAKAGLRTPPPAAAKSPPPAAAKDAPPPQRIEPNRQHRIAREREPLGGRLDLHGLDQDRARAALHAFIARAQDDGHRAVLIITGKGVRGDGVLRRRAPDWLGEPPSRDRVAGYALAERRHGGEGALYVALKRKTR
jgi:DNA-nicking Smr family endonuclease